MRRRFYNFKINIHNAPEESKQLIRRRIQGKKHTMGIDDGPEEKKQDWSHQHALSYRLPALSILLWLDVEYPWIFSPMI
jgi:hypothetical protein